MCWAIVGILSAVLLARRRTNDVIARCHFAHRSNLIVNRWFDVGPTPIAKQALHMPMYHSRSSIALGQRWPDMIYGHHLLMLIV